MFDHSQRGEVENGEIRYQLKARSCLATTGDAKWISQNIGIKDLRYWHFEPYPVIVIVYDAKRDCAFWLHIQDYIDLQPALLESDVKTITLRIPTRNKLNLRAIDHFRKLSLEIVANFRNRSRGN